MAKTSIHISTLKRLLVRLSHIPYLNRWLILLGDVCISVFATMLTIVFNESVLHIIFLRTSSILLVLSSLFASLAGFLLWHTHRGIIRHSTLQSTWRIMMATLTKAAFMYTFFFLMPFLLPHSILLFSIILDTGFTLILLLVFRVSLIFAYQLATSNLRNNRHRVLVYGTSAQNPQISALLNLNSRSAYAVAGYLAFGHPNRTYQIGSLNAHVIRRIEDLGKLLRKENIEGFLFASQSDLLAERDRLVAYSVRHHLKLFTVPPLDKWKQERRIQARAVSVEDLLGRDEIKIDLALIQENLQHKTVLVSGAAGSIGSELCRQIANLGVERLILLDFCETGMHNLRLELEGNYPLLQFVPIIGDVRSLHRLEFVFCKFHPHIIFHAAAYKHVPLMESNPCEALRVNAVGSRHMADMAIKYGCEKFIMISTDKAVNPTSVMGASKRIAEIYIQSLDRAVTSGHIQGKTRFITTRFGNVLGSQGSVIPRFREQIENGGPITVTHPKITRYFMTIREACLLVLEASAIGQGGDILVFDMGEAVKIIDLAKKMITLAGYTPSKDIQIVYSGLRPGEKLYEEMLNTAEETLETPHPKIRIASVREYPYDAVVDNLTQIEKLSLNVDIEGSIRLAKQMIPEYLSNNSEFEKLDTSS